MEEVYVVVADRTHRRRLATILGSMTSACVVCTMRTRDVPGNGSSIVATDMVYLEQMCSRLAPHRIVLVAPHAEDTLARAREAGLDVFVDERGSLATVVFAVLGAQLRIVDRDQAHRAPIEKGQNGFSNVIPPGNFARS